MNDMEKLMASGAVKTVGDIIADDLILFFDTETSGLPEFSQPSDSDVQPHIVSLAAELCRSDGTVIDTYYEVVNIGVPIPPEMIAIHGITDDIAADIGIAPDTMLTDFFGLVERASLVVGHNTSFDLRMVRIQSARHRGVKWDCPITKDDVMYMVAKEMKIRKPKLTEAYKLVFGKAFDDAHNALADCRATREIYFEMVKRGYVATNPRAVAGSNMPPVEEATAPIEVAPVDDTSPFDRVKKRIDDLYAEAKNWLDGDPIANDDQAAEVGKLRDMLRSAAADAEKERKIEAKPFDDGKAEVQARYNPLIQKDRGICDLAIQTCNRALAPWFKKIDDALRADALKQREIAEQAARDARDAALAAASTGDLGLRERAEDLLAQAKDSVSVMKAMDKAKPQVAGLSRMIGMKTVYHAELADPAVALEHYRATQPAALKEWLRLRADADVSAGKREIPGFIVTSERVPT